MFQIGLLLLAIGAVLVYATAPIAKVFYITTEKGIVILKAGGLILVVIGTVLVFRGKVPEELHFIKIFNF
ncbi:MAG: hypothetical protein JJT76_10935 [Clostridiaceae bacterium]|nr:hypothetical protein [Clostridiaceae bacterium]